MRKPLRELCRLIERHGIQVTGTSPRKGHVCLHLRHKDRTLDYVVAGTASDWRAQRNVLADVRRMLEVE